MQALPSPRRMQWAVPPSVGNSQIGSHTLALMTYLGHAHVSSTFWYLERSPQLMDRIAQACERFVEEATP